MTIFRVVATVETRYSQDVVADNSGEAASKLGDQIRAGSIEPTYGPAIAHIDVTRYRGSAFDAPRAP